MEYISDPAYDPGEYNSPRNITRILRTYRKYRRYVLDIHKAEQGYVIASELARMWHDTPEYRNMTPAERYRIVIHCGALDTMAISWLINGMPETPEEMAEIFCSSVHS